MQQRPGQAFWLVALHLAVAPCAASTPETQANFIGQVSDTTGVAVEGVVLYLTPADSGCSGPGTGIQEPAGRLPENGRSSVVKSSSPDTPVDCPEIVVVTTDGHGGFQGRVRPGRYRIAAVKPGYELLLSEIGIFTRGFHDLHLRPAPPGPRARGGHQDDDPDLDWILRKRRPDPLRDLRPAVAEVTNHQAPRSAGPIANLAQSLDGEMAWSMSGRDPFGDRPAAGETAGQAASLAFAGEMGTAGRWSVTGDFDKSATGLPGGEASRRQLRSEALAVAMDFRVGESDRIRGEIRYGQAMAESQQDATGTVSSGQNRRAASIHSRWERSLAGTGALYVDGSYMGTGMGWHASSAPAETTSALLPGLDTWRARAGYARELGSHALDFGMRASLQQGDPGHRDMAFQAADLESPAGSRVERSEIGLFGIDDWRVAARYTLNYGLGYWSDLDAGAGWLVPTVGFVRDPDAEGGIRLRSLLIFRLDDPLTDATGADNVGSRRSAGTRIGGLFGVEQRPVPGTRFAATLAVVPFHEDLIAGPGGLHLSDTAAPVLSDGEATRTELGIEVDHAFGSFHGSLSGNVGKVAGRVSPVVDDLPLQTLGEGEIRYWVTRMSGFYAPTETMVLVEVRRAVGSSAGDPGGEPEAHDYRRVDLVVQQPLPWMSQMARWRLLMAYRGLIYGASDVVPGGLTAGTVSRLSGGVSVVF